MNTDQYPIQVRIKKDYFEVSQPDLGIYRYRTKVVDLRKPADLGSQILDVFMEIMNMKEAPTQRVSTRRKWLTATEAAEQAQLSSQTIRRLADTGALKVFRTPKGHRKICRESLELYLSSR